MNGFFVGALFVAAVLAVWMIYRTRRLRREAEAREARMLEALFAARHAAGNGAKVEVDVDGAFGADRADVSPSDVDAVLRAAGMKGDLAAPGDKETAPAKAAPAAAEQVTDQTGAATPPAARPAVRDLVQVFYEARGFRAALADAAALPVERILTHRSDAGRSYAFAPLAGDLSRDDVQPIVDAARRVGQLRVLIACEGQVPAPLADALLAQGIRAFDRASVDAQLARIDAAVAERIRAGALRRSARRPGR